MKQELPYGDFTWLSKEDIERLNGNLSKEAVKGWIASLNENGCGAFVECNLKVPEHLHDRFNSYPPAPEKCKVKKEDISPFIEEMNRIVMAK